jgi:hypothetical protein
VNETARKIEKHILYMCLCLSEISYAYICESGAFDFLEKSQNRLAYCTLLNEPVVSVVDPYQDSTESASFWEPGFASKAHPDPQKLAADKQKCMEYEPI